LLFFIFPKKDGIPLPWERAGKSRKAFRKAEKPVRELEIPTRGVEQDSRQRKLPVRDPEQQSRDAAIVCLPYTL
jgi:hypothetical protein